MRSFQTSTLIYVSNSNEYTLRVISSCWFSPSAKTSDSSNETCGCRHFSLSRTSLASRNGAWLYESSLIDIPFPWTHLKPVHCDADFALHLSWHYENRSIMYNMLIQTLYNYWFWLILILSKVAMFGLYYAIWPHMCADLLTECLDYAVPTWYSTVY